MSPRTVQIWFQNKRQSIRTRERGVTHIASPPISPSIRHYASPPPPPTNHHHYNQKPAHISLPPLRLPQPPTFPLTPSSSVQSSPNSFDNSILFRDYWLHWTRSLAFLCYLTCVCEFVLFPLFIAIFLAVSIKFMFNILSFLCLYIYIFYAKISSKNQPTYNWHCTQIYISSFASPFWIKDQSFSCFLSNKLPVCRFIISILPWYM